MPRSTAYPVATCDPVRRAIRSAIAGLTAVTLTLGLSGCENVFKRKNTQAPSAPPASNPNNAPFWADPAAPRPASPLTANVPAPSGQPPPSPSSIYDPEVSGILAGRLVDSFNRPPPLAYVQVQELGDRSGRAPVDVETNNQGHFYIRGLVPGRAYRLTARSKRDGRVLAGEVIARPPDARLLIPMSEDFVSPATPPVPDTPQPPQSRRDTGPTAELGPPLLGTAPANIEQIASDAVAAATPRANIPTPPGLPDITPISATGRSPSAMPSAIPACLVHNGRVLTLSLYDADGQTWDLSQRQGHLTLIDFWWSNCGPCLRAIPELVRLQQSYRTRGLEVIGVACENGPAAENVRRVQEVRRRIPSINYRLLVAGEPQSDPVRAQFHLTAFPTAVLLDADGTILWRGTGSQTAELEPIVRQRLGGP